MAYDKFQKEMSDKKHGDGISVGAGYTGEFTLYGSLVISVFLLARVFDDILFALIGASILGIALSWRPLLFKFQKENSNEITNQMFWISMFCGALSLVIYFAR